MARRVPCVRCGTPTTHGATCAQCATGLTHNDAEYRRNRAIVLSTAKRCWLCGLAFQPGDAKTADHVVAIANGGTHALDNLRPAHETCNKRKGA